MDLIIGAGISGLSYANFCGHSDYIIIEKESSIGGYCKTIKQDGFTWDYSGHFFHFRDEKIKEYLLDRMPDQEILTILKKTQIYYKGNYIDFPFQKNIHQLEKEEFIDCLYDLFNIEQKEETSFKLMLYNKFGISIAEKFLIPYNEKLYACDLDLLDVNAMGRFFPYANKEEIIKNFKDKNDQSYNSTFTYPRGGAIEYIHALAKRIDSNKIHLNEEIINIDKEKKIAYTNLKAYKYDRIISSIPFPTLLKKAQVNYNPEIFSWNKVLVFNLGFNKKGIDKTNHWVYFPEKLYAFYRIGYYDNIFNDERLSLYVELGFPVSANINSPELLNIVLSDLKKANIIDDHQLISHSSIIMDPAYVHINETSESDKKEKMKELIDFSIYSIGRYGDWKYCSIEDNIIESKNLAIILNTK